MAINQITTSNTFQQWLTATQSLIAAANTLTDGNGDTFVANTILEISGSGSTLNVKTSAEINQLYSNNITVNDATNINLTSNGQVSFTGNIVVSGTGSSLNVESSAEINELYSNSIFVTEITNTDLTSNGVVTITGSGASLNVETSAEIETLYSNTIFNIDITTTNVVSQNVNTFSIYANTLISDFVYTDPTSYLTVSGDAFYQAFDANDYTSYDRINNRYNLFIDGSSKLYLDSGNLMTIGIISVDSNNAVLISSNTHIKVPVGTTAERDPTPDIGGIRYNTTLNAYEGYASSGWSSIGGGFTNIRIATTDQTANSSELYVLTANVDITLPASPIVGNFIGISNQSGYANSTILRNSENIMSLAEDMEVDSLYASFTLYYTGSTNGWVIL